MCAPVVPLIATGLSAIGTGVSMASSIGQARAQAAAADANAAAESNAAQISQQNMRQDALQQYQQMGQVSGQQNMMAAASGDATGYGTAANALNGTQIMGQQNLSRIYAQGNQNLMGADIGVANDLAQANAANSRGDAALAGGLFNLGAGLFAGGSGSSLSTGLSGGLASLGTGSSGTALGGASQYAPFRAGMGL
ncbi:hypothetical protein [Novosphingobium sp. FSW06-99]|uniref:hypothetical protein n=1 Tax=Novosphingobium sp. FSW06-99 TaxID=1739113 RepID=UPI00076D75D8|nr:hypothetical protein [Novosphingobium sp. FSW06-99]KUR79444.1 hypothetical protein AQZ49_05850 [Novosphingobium sp. FSW06-99]